MLTFVAVAAFLGSCSRSQRLIPDKQTTEASPNEPVGEKCDGCELMFEGMPEKIEWIDTLAGKDEAGVRMEVSGIVYKSDGITPAEGCDRLFLSH